MKKLFSILLVLLLFTACSSANDEQSAPSVEVGEDYARDYSNEKMGLTDSTTQSYDSEESYSDDYSSIQKLIKQYSLTMETKTYDEVFNDLKVIIENNNAYIQNSNEYNNTYSNTRTLSMTIRVPRENSSKFRDDISALGTVTNRSENVQDVTERYSDIDARLVTLYTEEETYLKLLEEANSVEEVLIIQNYLSDTRYQIESYESQKRNYDLLIAYDTLNLNLYEVEKITPVEERSIIDEIVDNFMESIQDIGEMLRNLVVFVFGNILYLAIMAVIGFILFRYRNKLVFKRKTKKNKNKNKIEEDNNV